MIDRKGFKQIKSEKIAAALPEVFPGQARGFGKGQLTADHRIAYPGGFDRDSPHDAQAIRRRDIRHDHGRGKPHDHPRHTTQPQRAYVAIPALANDAMHHLESLDQLLIRTASVHYQKLITSKNWTPSLFTDFLFISPNQFAGSQIL